MKGIVVLVLFMSALAVVYAVKVFETPNQEPEPAPPIASGMTTRQLERQDRLQRMAKEIFYLNARPAFDVCVGFKTYVFAEHLLNEEKNEPGIVANLVFQGRAPLIGILELQDIHEKMERYATQVKSEALTNCGVIDFAAKTLDEVNGTRLLRGEKLLGK